MNKCNSALYFGISVFSSVYIAQLNYAAQSVTKFGVIELQENLAKTSCFLISLSVMTKIIIKIPPLTPEILNNFLTLLTFIYLSHNVSSILDFDLPWSTVCIKTIQLHMYYCYKCLLETCIFEKCCNTWVSYIIMLLLTEIVLTSQII